MELLSPAGHWEAMVAAVQNGANAVYMGVGEFNARRGAKNFSEEEYPAAVAYCHLRGVKVYLTLNTLLTDRELTSAADLLRNASRWGVDGVIVQDWGVAALARKIVPDLPLHGSTQMTVHDLDGVKAAADLGMKCVVLSRELSKADIRYICERSPIAIEVFAHGALCMCYSGQCAMSALIGGRSGNRGTCAQPCRLPYRMDNGKNGYPLSLKDANLAAHLQELDEMGVSILKLEGRMKRPEYVAVITRIYSALLREKRLPTQAELTELERSFSRSGFTEGYWNDRLGPKMFGTRAENTPEPTALFHDAKTAYDKEDLRTIGVHMDMTLRADQPISLTATDEEGNSVCVSGATPEPARSRAVTAEELENRLAKTGGTVYRPTAVHATIEDGLAISAGAVNALRRDALTALDTVRCAVPTRREQKDDFHAQNTHASTSPAFTVSLLRGEQLTCELLALSPAIVYLPAERIAEFTIPTDGNTAFCVTLPRICKDRERDRLRDLLQIAKDKGCTSAAIHGPGQLALVRELGFSVVRGDFGLNLFNSRSLDAVRSWGLDSATLSFELRHEQLRDIKKCIPCEAIVYGRLPLMIMENCIIANEHGCQPRNLHGTCSGSHALTDRRGERFPVVSAFGCRNEILNGKTLYLADKNELRRCTLTYARLRFTTESPMACVAILEQYLGLQKTIPPQDHTRGLFYRGVE